MVLKTLTGGMGISIHLLKMAIKILVILLERFYITYKKVIENLFWNVCIYKLGGTQLWVPQER